MIRTILAFVVAMIVGLIIQATVIHGIYPDAIAPDFLLILVFFLGLHMRNTPGALGAYAIGLAGDFAGGVFVGPYAAGSVIAFIVVVLFANHIYAERGPAMVIVAFFASLAKSATYLVFLAAYPKINPTLASLTTLFGEAVLTALCAPLVLWLLRWGQSRRFLNPVVGELYRRGA